MLDLFVLRHEAPQDQLIVLEVEEFHAQLEGHLRLESVHQLLPKSKIEDGSVCLHPEGV